MLTWRVAGIILVPINEQFASREVIVAHHVKAVIVDRLPEAQGFDSVTVNNGAATAAATRRLIELGHTTILAVASSRSVPNMLERIVAFEAVAAGAGLTRNCAVICYSGSSDVVRYGEELASITEAIAARLVEWPRPTAMFTLNNIATLAALKALGGLGLRIPEDISLLGFDDYEWMQVFRPSISAVRQPVEELARHAWERLMQRLRGDVVAHAKIQLACSIEWRDSVLLYGSDQGA
jgi:LacI family transcriptional regulator